MAIYKYFHDQIFIDVKHVQGPILGTLHYDYATDQAIMSSNRSVKTVPHGRVVVILKLLPS